MIGRVYVLASHGPAWRPAPLRIDAAGNTAPGYVCVHPLENGRGRCGSNVFRTEDAIGDHCCFVARERQSANRTRSRRQRAGSRRNKRHGGVAGFRSDLTAVSP